MPKGWVQVEGDWYVKPTAKGKGKGKGNDKQPNRKMSDSQWDKAQKDTMKRLDASDKRDKQLLQKGYNTECSDIQNRGERQHVYSTATTFDQHNIKHR